MRSCVLVADEPIGGGASKLAQGGFAAARSIATNSLPCGHGYRARRRRPRGPRNRGTRDCGDHREASTGSPGRHSVRPVAGWRAGTRPRSRARPVSHRSRRGRSHRRRCHARDAPRGDRAQDIRVLEGLELVDLITCGDRKKGVLLITGMGAAARSARAPADGASNRRRWGLFRPHDQSRVLAGRGTRSRCALRAAARRPRIRAVPPDRARYRIRSPAPADRSASRRRRPAAQRFGQAVHAAVHSEARLAEQHGSAPRRRAASRRPVRWLDASRMANAQRDSRPPVAGEASGTRSRPPAASDRDCGDFHMGGIATDDAGRTSLAGLSACGEVAASGLTAEIASRATRCWRASCSASASRAHSSRSTRRRCGARSRFRAAG